MAKIKDFIYRYRNILLFLAYIAVSFAVLLHHEPFRDEINTWAVLQNVPIKNLPHDLTYGGHPVLYYLFWLPFVKIGFPFAFYRIMAWLACSAAVFMLCVYSPFSFAVKALITFSSPMIYWYPSITRCYSFLPIIVFLLVFLSDKIKDSDNRHHGFRVILFCIIAGTAANLHLIFGMLGGAIFIVLAFRKLSSKQKFSLNEIIAASLFFLLLAIPAAQTFAAYNITESSNMNIINVLENIIRNFSCSWQSSELIPHAQWVHHSIEDSFSAIVFFAFLIIVSILFQLSPRLFFIFAASASYHFLVYLSKYPVFLPFRTYTFETILLACIWAAAALNPKSYAKKKNFLEMSIAFLIIPSVFSGTEMAYTDWKEPFTPDIAMAEYIDRNIPAGEKTIIYLADPARLAGVKFYSKKHIFYDINGNILKYIVYPGHLIKSIPENQEDRNIYFIDQTAAWDEYNGTRQENNRAKKLFCSNEGIIGPKMCIYAIID